MMPGMEMMQGMMMMPGMMPFGAMPGARVLQQQVRPDSALLGYRPTSVWEPQLYLRPVGTVLRHQIHEQVAFDHWYSPTTHRTALCPLAILLQACQASNRPHHRVHRRRKKSDKLCTMCTPCTAAARLYLLDRLLPHLNPSLPSH